MRGGLKPPSHDAGDTSLQQAAIAHVGDMGLRRPFTIHYAPCFQSSRHYIKTPPKKGANMHEKRALPKGKQHLKRGSNRSGEAASGRYRLLQRHESLEPPTLHPSSPFLAPLKTPRFLSKNSRFPLKNDCLDIIEPRIEPRTPRGRFQGYPEARKRRSPLLFSSFLLPLSCNDRGRNKFRTGSN